MSIHDRRRRPATALTALALTGVVIAAACGGGDDPAPGEGTTAVEQPPEVTEGDPSEPAEDTATGGTTAEPTDERPTDEPTSENPTDDEPSDEPTSDDGPAPGTVVVGAAGDILPHARVLENGRTNAAASDSGGYDFTPMFADVTDLLTAPDISLCHLETPLSSDNTNLTVPRTLVFNTPREMADALAGAGFDGCDFASNHTYDRGLAGVADTEQVVEGAGMEYAGPSPTAEGVGAGAWYEVDDITVAQLAYTYTVLNDGSPNTAVPSDAPWMEHYLWLNRGAEGIIEDAAQARADGADFVVLSMHWGNEYQATPTNDQSELARDLLESDQVDLIIGTHVHVVQPCEEINGRYVLYGMGNFLSNQSPSQDARLLAGTQDGLIAHVELTRAADRSVSSELAVQPTFVQIDNHHIRLASPDEYAESYERTLSALTMLGEDSCSFAVLGD